MSESVQGKITTTAGPGCITSFVHTEYRCAQCQRQFAPSELTLEVGRVRIESDSGVAVGTRVWLDDKEIHKVKAIRLSADVHDRNPIWHVSLDVLP